MPVFGALFHSKNSFSILSGLCCSQNTHDQSAGPAPARWKAGSAAAAMGRSIRASPADKEARPRPQHPAGERFLCSLRLNCCRSGPIRPTGGTPERQNTQKASIRHRPETPTQAPEWPQTMAARGIVPQNRPDWPAIREAPGGNRGLKLLSILFQFNYTPNRPKLSICILYKIEPCNLSIFTLFIRVHL